MGGEFGSFPMDRFIARANIKHLRGQLEYELDPACRATLMKLLVEEEDKLARDLSLLADLDQHIGNGHHRIQRQMVVVATMERDGHDGVGQAKALLVYLEEAQNLHERYRQLVLKAVQESEL
jgi:hypothetical protein